MSKRGSFRSPAAHANDLQQRKRRRDTKRFDRALRGLGRL
jgi:hypothetical protein